MVSGDNWNDPYLFRIGMLFGYNSDPSRFGGIGIVGIFMFVFGLIICLYPAIVKQQEESEKKGIEIPELPPVYINRISIGIAINLLGRGIQHFS